MLTQISSLQNKCRTTDPDRQNLGQSGKLSFFIIYKFWQNCASVRQVPDLILKTDISVAIWHHKATMGQITSPLTGSCSSCFGRNRIAPSNARTGPMMVWIWSVSIMWNRIPLLSICGEKDTAYWKTPRRLHLTGMQLAITSILRKIEKLTIIISTLRFHNIVATMNVPLWHDNYTVLKHPSLNGSLRQTKTKACLTHTGV